jgi:hypothetical protein
MLRKLLLGVGLVLELAGVILVLIVQRAIEELLSGYWPPLSWVFVPFEHMSPREFFDWFLFLAAFLLVLGFVFLSFGILYPKQSTQPVSECEENKA